MPPADRALNYAMRQAVVSVRQPTGNTTSPDIDVQYAPATTNVVFRAPYHTLGLAINFSFQKSFFAAFSECQLTIENNSSDMANAFSFNYKNYLLPRPLVEIRAGYSTYQLTDPLDVADINAFKKTLPLAYTGFPYYLYDQKIRGGRQLDVRLHNFGTFRLKGPSSRITSRFPAGSPLSEVLQTCADRGAFPIDLTHMGATATTRIRTALFYNNRQILSDVFPELARQYNFFFFKRGNTTVFFPAGVQVQGALRVVSASTGLIEYPAKQNWTHWAFKTLFAQPEFLQPGDWVDLQDPAFANFYGLPSDRVSGIITQGGYNWNDDNADCDFTLAPEGFPVESRPILVV